MLTGLLPCLLPCLLQQVVARLVSNFERLRVVNVELARRAILSDLVAGSRASWWAKRMQKLRAGMGTLQQQQPQQAQPPQPLQQQRDEWRQAFRSCPRDLQQQLEASFIADVSYAKLLGGFLERKMTGDEVSVPLAAATICMTSGPPITCT